MTNALYSRFHSMTPSCMVSGLHAQQRLELARAEQWAEDEGLEVVTMPDDMPWDGDTPEPLEVVGVVLIRPCPQHGHDCKHADHLGSLWGIGLTGNTREDRQYLRSIAAELALEAMGAAQ